MGSGASREKIRNDDRVALLEREFALLKEQAHQNEINRLSATINQQTAELNELREQHPTETVTQSSDNNEQELQHIIETLTTERVTLVEEIRALRSNIQQSTLPRNQDVESPTPIAGIVHVVGEPIEENVIVEEAHVVENNSFANSAQNDAPPYCKDNIIRVQGIGYPGSLFDTSGKVFRISSVLVECILGRRWDVPLLRAPSYLSTLPIQSTMTMEELDTRLRSVLLVKGGEGLCLRACNTRTGKSGGIMVWRYVEERKDGLTDCLGCWNPFEYCTNEDWAVGDEIVFPDFEPSIFRNIRGAESVGTVSEFYALAGTGWNLDGKHVQFGRCGVVGGWWKELSLEASITPSNILFHTPQLEKDCCHDMKSVGYAVSGVWTDSVQLPFKVEVQYTSGHCDVLADACTGPFVPLVCKKGECVKSVRLYWESTDLHQTQGLSTYRSGGGIHVEVLVKSIQ